MLYLFVLFVFFWREKSQIQSLQKEPIPVLQLLQKVPVGPSHKGYPPWRPPTQNNKGSRIINAQAPLQLCLFVPFVFFWQEKSQIQSLQKEPIPVLQLLQKVPVGPSHKGYPPWRPPTQNNKGSRIINLQAIFCYICLRSLFCTIILKKNCRWTLLQRKRAPKS